MSESQAGASTQKRPKSILNKKERQNIESMKGMTGAQLLDTVVKYLSEALHIHFPEREGMFASLLDSCQEELEKILLALHRHLTQEKRKIQQISSEVAFILF